MIGEVNSPVESDGDVMGDGTLSAPLGILGLAMRRGDEGALDMRPGEVCRTVPARLGRTRLCRFLSRERWLATRLKELSALGEAARR